MNNKLKAKLDQNYLESKKVHENDLSKESLIKRIADNAKKQKEKDRLYDLENNEKVTFNWED